MTKSSKMIIGFLTVWPLIYIIFLYLSIFKSLSPFQQNPPSIDISILFPGLIALHFATFFLMIGSLIGYIRHANRNKRIAKGDRLAWAIMLFIGSFIAQSIYWYTYIWKNKDR